LNKAALQNFPTRYFSHNLTSYNKNYPQATRIFSVSSTFTKIALAGNTT